MKAYHAINQPKQRRHLSKRRSSVEPLFDLIASYWNFDPTKAVTGQGVFQRPLLFSYSGLIAIAMIANESLCPMKMHTPHLSISK